MSEDKPEQTPFPDEPTMQELQQIFEQKYESFKLGERARVDTKEDGSKARNTYVAYEIATSKPEGTTDFLLDAAQSGHSLWGSVTLKDKPTSVLILQKSS